MPSLMHLMPGHKYLLPFFQQVLHDPVTATVVAASAVSAAGSIQKGNAEAKNFKSQAAADEYNAAIDRQNAEEAGKVGTQQELTTRERNAQQLGEGRAAIGEANIGGPQGGTQSLALEQDSVNAELSALGVRYQRDTQMAGLEDSARQQDFQSQVARNNAQQARISGYIGAVGSVLGGANKMASFSAADAAAATPTSASFNPGASYGPFDNSLPWRNQPYTSRGGSVF